MAKKRKSKLKIKKSILRRFKVTAGGKLLHLRSFRRHLKVHKAARQQKNKPVELLGANAKKIRKMLAI